MKLGKRGDARREGTKRRGSKCHGRAKGRDQWEKLKEIIKKKWCIVGRQGV